MYQLKVESMHCMSCFHNINDALSEFDSEIEVNVDMPNKLLLVKSEFPLPEVIKVIEEAGYPAIAESNS